MKSVSKHTWMVLITVVTYILMIAINALANILPINGMSTGAVSERYSNLFAPAGITFSIWGLIYLLLLGHVVYQVIEVRTTDRHSKKMLYEIGILFSISSVINTIWIFMWHYDFIGITLILMLMLLSLLIVIRIRIEKYTLNFTQKLLIRLPFSIYFGWITIATIANVTTYLVYSQWEGFGLSEPFWMNIILIVGGTIGIITLIRLKDMPYGLVIVWAYIGILIKHLSQEGYKGDYISVIITTIFVILMVIFAEYLVLRYQLIKRNRY
ncbi:tryptophan-rich sensory protein [Petrocella sp. FN5]|uniref:tryptophan-rich sensory protein n=1 Tax=Petrocella sp. FN5 TaxID=3032002 RepID=UPI0023DAD99E|nr:tryptophan-rich sensory protein [Petrocella sp. FN5]MDF1617208.1 tryptophan-rich sensory protein [Petrocella sp. FN5]